MTNIVKEMRYSSTGQRYPTKPIAHAAATPLLTTSYSMTELDEYEFTTTLRYVFRTTDKFAEYAMKEHKLALTYYIYGDVISTLDNIKTLLKTGDTETALHRVNGLKNRLLEDL